MSQELEDGLCLAQISPSQTGENMLQIKRLMRSGSRRFIGIDAMRVARVLGDALFSRPTKAFGNARAAHLENDCFPSLGKKLS
ncbi:hypothetical protein KR49_13935 [Synechococcus sp. KORDI-49]|nr:hypothetical protein KR49_13935 [Synechococcus sp. KORDI-49]